MITVTVSTRGITFTELSEKIREIKQKLVARLADVAYAAAFNGAPWRTGKLAQSITKEVSVDEAWIRATAPYAVHVEYGTAPHEIRPVRASCLAFKTADGNMVFTKLVHHPGTKPNPFMHRAAETTKEKIGETFEAIWNEEMT